VSKTRTKISPIDNSEEYDLRKGQSGNENRRDFRLPLLIAGSVIGLYAWARRPSGRAAMSTAGFYAAKQMGKLRGTRKQEAVTTFAINCTPETAYRYWRDFANLPRFMRHIDSVRVFDGNKSEWTALGPLEMKVRWTAELTEDKQNERIAWRSLPGSQVETNGSVEFRPGANGRGTLVTARVEFAPPAGSVGRAFAAIVGKDPEFTVREDLRRFKALIEAGEVPTTIGQSHGPRGVHGHAHQVLLREKQNSASPQVGQPLGRTA
jgi:uncharacterized membrane protein